VAAKKKKTVAKPKTERSTAKGDSAHSHTRATELAIPYERGIFRGSSRVDAHNVRAVFYLENEDREVETIEPIERIRDLEPGTECGILVGDVSGRASLKAHLPPLPPQDLGWFHPPTFLMDVTRIRENAYGIQHVVFKRELRTKESGNLAIFTRPSGDEVAIAMLPQSLEHLVAGDVCEIIFFTDPEELAAGNRATLVIGDIPFDSRANFLRVVQKAGSVKDVDLHWSLQQLPTPVLEEIPTEQLRSERERVPTADEILADISAVQEPIISKLNMWLSSFEGKTFSPEEASGVVAEIRHVVARAGCELLFEGRSVSLTTSTGTGAKSASLQVYGLRERPAPRLYTKTRFPALSVQPIQEK